MEFKAADDLIQELSDRVAAVKAERERARREAIERLRKLRQARVERVRQVDERKAKIQHLLDEMEGLDARSELEHKCKQVVAELDRSRQEDVIALQFDPKESDRLLAEWQMRAQAAGSHGAIRGLLQSIRDSIATVDPEACLPFVVNICENHPLKHEIQQDLREIQTLLEDKLEMINDEERPSTHIAAIAERAAVDSRKAELYKRAEELLQQVDAQSVGLDNLGKDEIRAMLEIWACDAKRIELEADQCDIPRPDAIDKIFGILVKRSKELQPGYTEVLDRRKTLDYAVFREGARARLQKAIEHRKQREEAADREKKLSEQREKQKAIALLRLDDATKWLEAFLVDLDKAYAGSVPESSLPDFRKHVHRVLENLPPDAEMPRELLKRLEPHERLFTGPEFRRLRRAFDRWRDLVPVAPACPNENSGQTRRRILSRIVEKFLASGKVGGSHTSVEHVMRGFADHEKGIAKTAFDALVADGLVIVKNTNYGKHFSFDPTQMRQLEEIAEGRFTLPRVREFAEGNG